MLHLRNEHDVVDYVSSHLRNYPHVLAALDADSYRYLGYRGYAGLMLEVTTLCSGTVYEVGVLIGKPPAANKIWIRKKEVDDARSTETSTEHGPSHTSERCASVDKEADEHRAESQDSVQLGQQRPKKL